MMVLICGGFSALNGQMSEVVKDDRPITDRLTDGVSWVGGVVPGPSDIARFDATMATAGNPFHQIGGDLAVFGIKVVDPKVLNVTSGYGISPSQVTSPVFAYTGTLVLGAGGIDFSEAVSLPQHTGTFFAINPPIRLSASQVWDIPQLAPNLARVLSVGGSTVTAPRRTAEVDLGGHTLTKKGNGLAGFYFDRTVKDGRVIIEEGTLVFANAFNPGLLNGDGTLNTTSSSVSNITQDQGATLSLEVKPDGVLAVCQAPTIGSGILNWDAAIELQGGTLHLNRRNYLGSVALAGTISALIDTTSTVLYDTSSNWSAVIRPTISATLSGGGDLIFNLATSRTQDRVVLTGDQSGFSGDLTVAAGHLLVNQPLRTGTSTGKLVVGEGATLGGAGAVGEAEVLGTVDPGEGFGEVGTLRLGETRLSGALQIDLSGAASDRIEVDGTLVIEEADLTVGIGAESPQLRFYVIAVATEITGAEGLTPPEGYELSLVGEVGTQLLILRVPSIFDYQTWAAETELEGGPNDDDDGDGLSNFDEYAFGLDPQDSTSRNGLFAPDRSTGTMTYTRRPVDLSGLRYTYQSSTDLSQWDDFEAVEEMSDGGDPIETVTISLPGELLSEPTLFIKVLAVQP